MAQYLRINWNGDQTVDVPTKATIDNLDTGLTKEEADQYYLPKDTDIDFNGHTINNVNIENGLIDNKEIASTEYVDNAISTASTGITGTLNNLQEQVNQKQGIVTASGILKGNGSGSISAAVAGTDYPDPAMYTSTGIVLPDNANDTIRFGFYGGMDLFFLSSNEFYPNLANCNLGNNNGRYWMNGYIKYLKSYELRLMDQNSTGTTTDDKDGMTMQYNEDEQCIEFLSN